MKPLIALSALGMSLVSSASAAGVDVNQGEGDLADITSGRATIMACPGMVTDQVVDPTGLLTALEVSVPCTDVLVEARITTVEQVCPPLPGGLSKPKKSPAAEVNRLRQVGKWQAANCTPTPGVVTTARVLVSEGVAQVPLSAVIPPGDVTGIDLLVAPQTSVIPLDGAF